MGEGEVAGGGGSRRQLPGETEKRRGKKNEAREAGKKAREPSRGLLSHPWEMGLEGKKKQGLPTLL